MLSEQLTSINRMPNTHSHENFRPIRGGFYPIYNCKDLNHNPPSHMVFSSAGHWVCPSCGHETFIMGPATCTQL